MEIWEVKMLCNNSGPTIYQCSDDFSDDRGVIVLGGGDYKIKGILFLDFPDKFFSGSRSCFGNAVVDDDLRIPGPADSVIVILGVRDVEKVDESIEVWWGLQ
jgi:hypothetical protein